MSSKHTQETLRVEPGRWDKMNLKLVHPKSVEQMNIFQSLH